MFVSFLAIDNALCLRKSLSCLCLVQFGGAGGAAAFGIPSLNQLKSESLGCACCCKLVRHLEYVHCLLLEPNCLATGQLGAVPGPKKRIMILMSDTGGGHRASADAIKAGFHILYGDKYEVRHLGRV